MLGKPIVFLVGLLFGLCSGVRSESSPIMVALQKAQHGENDSVKIFNYSELCYLYTGRQYDSAVFFGNKGLALARKVKHNLGIKQCLTDLGILYSRSGKYPLATQHLLEALALSEKSKDEKSVINMLNNLGVVYHHMKDYQKALQFYKRALAYDVKNDHKANISMRLTNLGTVYRDLKMPDTSLVYQKRALDMAYASGNEVAIARALNNYAEMLDLFGDRKACIKLYLEAYALNQKIGNYQSLYITAINCALTYRQLQKKDSALYFAQKAFELADEFKAPEYYKDAYNVLALAHEDLNKPALALKYFKLYLQYKDSIFNIENSQAISDLKTEYEVHKKEMELTAKARAEKIKAEAVQAEKEYQNRLVLTFVLIVFGVVVVFSVFLYRRFQLTKRQKQVIELQKHLVEQKNKEITDSMEYAKSLQEAILPDLNQLHQWFQEWFVLYKPKDIIAGDFYWMQKMEDEKGLTVFLAVADCTGHGVPGAMVSVVCANALNKAVTEMHLSHTSAILDATRELVIQTFEHSGRMVRDGMDISLCALRKSNKGTTWELTWSGANNPLWIFTTQPGTQEKVMVELKPDKQPVSKHENASAFTQQTTTLKSGDGVYLFSDGYADQFGGEKGKKFKLKNLQAQLAQLVSLPMKEQGEALDQLFEQWKNDLEQTDDVTVLGFKVD